MRPDADFFPVTRFHEIIARADFAANSQHQSDGEIRYILGQCTEGRGDRNAAGTRKRQIDCIRADAVDGNHFQCGKSCDQIVGNAGMSAGNHAPDRGAVFTNEGILVVLFEQAMHGVAFAQCVVDCRNQDGIQLQDVRLQFRRSLLTDNVFESVSPRMMCHLRNRVQSEKSIN